jgi:O-antigen/teichoic acid export membrane protein
LTSAIPAGGYNVAALRFIGQGLADKDHAYTRGYITNAIKIISMASTVMALLAIAGAFLLPGFTAENNILYFATVIGIPFFALMRANNGIAMASARYALGYLPNNVLRPILFLLFIWLLLQNDKSLDSGLAMLMQLLAIVTLAMMTSVLMWQSVRQLAAPDSPINESRVWNRAAMSLMGVEIFTNYFQPITVIVSGLFLPKADIGIYNVGYRVALVISFMLIAVDAFTAPIFSRHYRRRDRVQLIRGIQHSTALRFGISFSAVIFLVLYGEWVLNLFGPEFVGGYKIMILLAFAQLSHAAVGPVARLLAISGHHKHSLYASGASLALWLVLTAFLMPAYGILGVAIAVFFSLTTWALVLRHFVARYMKISILVVVRDLEPRSSAA